MQNLRQTKFSDGVVVLVGAAVFSVVLGSIHAFSVFLEPLEQQFSASRSAVALSYSQALVALTAAVLFGPKIYGRWSAASFILLSCILAAGGAMIAGVAGSLPLVWFGYSFVFGLANGLGYGFGLQISAKYNPGREGFAMGVVTAAYAFGAVISPPLFSFATELRGFSFAMTALAIALLCTGGLSAVLMMSVKARFHAIPVQHSRQNKLDTTQVSIWIGYFGSVMAGLMIIGHAAGITSAFQPRTVLWISPVVIAACNLLGSLIAGRLVDKVNPGKLLVLLALLTSISVFGIIIFGRTSGLLVGLGAVGFAYGGSIAAFPGAIAKLFGMQNSASVYGRVFTAWGGAGLLGPWVAGALFDQSGDYRYALYAAVAAGLISATAIAILFRKPVLLSQ